MKIREGAYYRTRHGDVVGPMRKEETHSFYPWVTTGHGWTISGRFSANSDGPLDLISEVYVSDTPPSDAPAPETKTLRDEFAITVMGSLLYNRGETGTFADYAEDAYEYADSMMEARKK